MTKRLAALLPLLALFLAAAAPALQTGGFPLTALGAEQYEILQGPFDELRLPFHVPPSWQVEEGGLLTLDLQTFFSSFVPAQQEVAQEELVAGNLSVWLDGSLLSRDVLSQNGVLTLSIPLPAGAFAARPDHELLLDWDASASCDLNLSTTVLVGPNSNLLLAQTASGFEADLGDLPYPFFTRVALEHPGTFIIVPTDASAANVGAALLVAAGLGRGSSDAITILTEDQLSVSERAAHHLIFVGPVAAFDSLNGVTLPHANSPRLSSQPEAGFVEISASPWNIGLGLLVVSGGTDDALRSAALQAGSGNLVLSAASNLAVVEGNPEFAIIADSNGATLAQLGFGDHTFTSYGRSEISIPFYVAPDRAVSQQAYLDLRFAHSELVDYLRSGLTLSLNGAPLSSIRLSDQSAPRHSEVVLLSPTALRPGWNQLTVAADILPLDLCASEAESQHWLTVYSDSTFNLPPAETTVATNTEASFASLPSFFGDGMRNTTLLLSSDRATWGSAAELLRGLAAQTWPLQPQVDFIAASPDILPNGQNMLVVASFNDYATFASPSYLQPAANNTGQVVFASGARVGYDANLDLGLLAADDHSLAILGNSPTGLSRAVAELLAPRFADQNRNASLIVLQGDTLLHDDGAPAAAAEPTQVAETASQTSAITDGKGWYLYVLLVLMLFAVGLIVWDQGYQFVKRRFGKK